MNLLISRTKLKYELATSNFTKEEVAKRLGITRTTLYDKVQGKIEFKESEVRKLIDIFGDRILLKKLNKERS